MKSLHALASIAVALPFQLAPAVAADRYPSRPVRLIVPYAPAGTPKDVGAGLNREITTALGTTGVRERVSALALDINPASVDGFRALIESELRRWKEVVAQTNSRLEQ